MELVKSFEEYKDWMSRGRSLKSPVTNCYFMPAAVKEKINAQKFSVLELETGFLFLEREDGFYRCYYSLSLDARYQALLLDMPGVAEYVFQKEITEAQNKELNLLQQMGFTLGRESERLSLDSESLKSLCVVEDVTAAREQDVPDILALLRSCFNPLYAFLPCEEELSAAIEQKNVLTVYECGTPVAVLFSEVSRNTASIRHLAVKESCRSRGYAKELVQAYHTKYQHEVKTFAHWVDRNNRPAIELYQKFGYSFSGKRSNEYILNEK